MPLNSEPKKDTVYIDVDDEITSIVEKLQQSPQKIVALVLPKRATVLQSAVNMKLLKKMADNAHKQIVLITSEAGLLPLAGATGLYVASSLQSRPVIPDSIAGSGRDWTDEVIDETDAEALPEPEFDPAAAAGQPVGALAGLPPAKPSAFKDPEVIELDNEDAVEPAAVPLAAAAAKQKKSPKGTDKKLKVPNFNRFRTILVVAILGLLLLGGGFIYANAVLPKAIVTLQTNSTNVSTKATLTLDPTDTQLDAQSDTLPAKVASKQQTGSQSVSTTGQKNNGTKASGEVTMTSQVCGSSALTATSPEDVPSGTGVSSNGKTFITQKRTTFPDSGSFKSGCVTYQATSSTDVIGQSAGADYNISAGSFTVAGRSEVTAKSSDAFSGGTDNIVKTVTQADIDSAKNKITSQDSSDVKDQLTTQLSSSGYQAIASSLHTGDPVVTPSAQVGSQADTVSVNQATTYTLYGVKTTDLKQIITASVNKQIDTTKQQILKDGLDQAKYQVSTTTASGPLQVTLVATSLAGPDIQADKLAGQLAGKKTGEVQTLVKAIPGVTDVSVKYSPFWVSKVPKKADKVAIVIDKAGT